MTYTTKISSKGQITIPIAARRQLGLTKTVQVSLQANQLVITGVPGMQAAWQILDAPAKGKGLSTRERHIAKTMAAKDKLKRGY
jgi:bifunctional DNA-binding transcriptional regulator/antitoxin component of YhaV-PrlF toxin-antitoxin module